MKGREGEELCFQWWMVVGFHITTERAFAFESMVDGDLLTKANECAYAEKGERPPRREQFANKDLRKKKVTNNGMVSMVERCSREGRVERHGGNGG